MAKTLRDTATEVGKTAANTVGRATETASGAGKAAQNSASAPTDLLRSSVRNLAATLAERAVSGLSNRVSDAAGRLDEYAEDGRGNLLAALTGVEKLSEGASPLRAAMSGGMSKLGHTVREKFEAVKQSFSGGKGKGGGGKKLKVTNIVEHIDVGVPIDLAYDQWTRFADFPKFTKKLEQVEQVEDQKLNWTGKVFWSRRTWESTIVDQVPFERIVWRSKGAKGYIDGAVTFHELTPDLTRILVILEYHPQGPFEKTANLWRAAGRRCRLELKHFQRHVMTEAVLHSEDVVGWHGEIHDSEVVEDDETARRNEQADSEDENTPVDTDADDTDESGRDDEDADDTDAHGRDEDAEDDDEDEDATADDSAEDENGSPRPVRRQPTRRKSTAARRSTAREGASR